MSNIRRFNNFPMINNVDVAQHSYYTTMMACTFAEECNRYAQMYNECLHPYDENVMDYYTIQEVMAKSLFHDVEEAFTSDIPWNVKHQSKEVHDAISDCIEKKLESIYDGCSKTLRTHLHYMRYCKSNDMEGRLVDICDAMDCAWSCYLECEMGNVHMSDLLYKSVSIIKNHPEYNKLYEQSPTFKEMFDLFDNLSETIGGYGLMIID